MTLLPFLVELNVCIDLTVSILPSVVEIFVRLAELAVTTLPIAELTAWIEPPVTTLALAVDSTAVVTEMPVPTLPFVAGIIVGLPELPVLMLLFVKFSA